MLENKIRMIIAERGLKLTKVSQITGINYQRLQRVFNQHSSMSATEMILLCSFLKLDPMMLADDKSTEKTA